MGLLPTEFRGGAADILPAFIRHDLSFEGGPVNLGRWALSALLHFYRTIGVLGIGNANTSTTQFLGSFAGLKRCLIGWVKLEIEMILMKIDYFKRLTCFCPMKIDCIG